MGEYRFITFGLSQFNRLLVVSHTEKHGKIRIISTRKMTKKERKIIKIYGMNIGMKT